MALTVEQIQAYIKDQADLNILLEGNLQSSQELIELCIQFAVDDFNAEQPVSGYGLANFPNDLILLYGVLHHLCNGEAERQLRNQVSYNAQGVNAGLDDKFPQYQNLSQYYRGLFESKTAKLKQAINIDAAWGGVFSPYAGINTADFQD